MSSFLLCSVLLVAGCESEKHHIDSQIVKAEPEVKTYDVSYDLNVSSEENKVKVVLSINNSEDNPIPLITKDEKLFTVKLKDSDGTVLSEKTVQKEDRIQVLRNEEVDWYTEFEANMDKELIVESEIHLESEEYQKINIEEKKQVEPVKVSAKKLDTTLLQFAPNDNVVYKYKVDKNTEIEKEYMYFTGNKVQSFSKESGVEIYSQESDGLYYLHSNDPVGDIDGTQFIGKEEMNLLIPFPIVEGTTWEVDSKNYILSDGNVKVRTTMDLFNDCIEITEIDGKEKRYYYYHKDIGLLKVKKVRKGLPSKVELQLDEIENVDNLKKNEE